MKEYEVHWLWQGKRTTVCGIETERIVFALGNFDTVTCQYCRLAQFVPGVV